MKKNKQQTLEAWQVEVAEIDLQIREHRTESEIQQDDE